MSISNSLLNWYRKLKQVLEDSNIALENKGFNRVNSLGEIIPEIERHGEINCLPYLLKKEIIEVTENDLAGVTTLRKYTFENLTSLTDITIPDSITSIGDFAFNNCKNIEKVHIKDVAKWCNISFSSSSSNPLYYGEDLYLNGEKVTELVIPDGVTSIGPYAFFNCTSLTSVTIPDSVTSIGNYAFYNCNSLTSVTIGNSVTRIGSYAFRNCSNLTDIIIPNSVTSIGSSAFKDCTSLTSITIPNSVTSIGDDAFYNCTGLTSVTIGNGVTSIGSHAFTNCTSLTDITIPNSVTSIGGYAFSGCTSLANIIIPNSVTSIGNSAFRNTAYYNNENNWENDVLYINNCFIGAKPHINYCEIQNGTRLIAEFAFLSCTSLTTVIIPDSITSITRSAFNDCTSLTSVTIPDGITSIGESAFRNCINLIDITIPDSVTSIGNYAFSFMKFTNITIPKNVTKIGYGVFMRGTYDFSLQNVYINAVTPPILDYNHTAETFPRNTVIHVPVGSGEAYKNATNWSLYSNRIIEDIEVN